MISAAKLIFKPELLNRFDDVIVFKKLDKEDVVRILDIELAKVRQRLEAKAITLELDAAATEFLVGKGYDPSLGARPLRRAVERYLEDPLAEELLRGMLVEGVIEAGLAEDKQSLVFRMRGELPLRTPQPGGETVRAAPAAEVSTKTPEKEAAPKAKKRPARGKKQGE
jgi:ATP-dependent Clp protease ATP-binding subunit ClpC